MESFQDKVKPYFKDSQGQVRHVQVSPDYPLLRPTDVPQSMRSSYYLAQQWVQKDARETRPAVPR